MNYENLLYDTVDRVTTITINRPKFLNALNHITKEELKDAFTRAKQDSVTKVVIFTGMGEKAFSAGADVNDLTLLDPIKGKETAQKGQAIAQLIEDLGKPTIAALNGFALGGGLELALACSMRVASSNAKLGLPEIGLGIMPGYGGSQRLSRLVGKGRAIEIILSGEPIDAQEAYRIGLVNKIFPNESLMEETRRFAERFVQKGAISLRLAMEAVHHGLDLPLDKGCELEALLAGLCLATEDAKEGVRAFLEKRKPIFNDR